MDQENIGVHQLKRILREKGAKTVGTKKVLQERVRNWTENKLNRRLYSVPKIQKNLCVKHFPDESKNWINLPKLKKVELCELSIGKIDSWFNKNFATASKIRGRNLGLNGYCDTVQYVQFEHEYYVKFVCHAAMKVNTKYRCKVRYNLLEIVQATCECPAGKGWSAACKHISAGLHVLEHFYQTGKSLERQSPTSQLQRWHQPSRYSRSSVFSLDDLIQNTNTSIPLTAENTDLFLNTEINNRNMSHLTRCRNVNPDGLFLDHDYDKKNIALIYLNELNSRSLSETHQIEKQTRKQSECKIWWEEKRSRISASCAADVCSTVRSRKLSKKIAHKIILQKKFSNAAMEHGKKFEKVALKHYIQLRKVQIIKCGLFIDQELHYVAASPDGMYKDRSKLIEIKCPTSHLPIDMPYLIFDNVLGRKTLSPKHRYYLQCQLQMHVTQIYKCDFIVWSTQHIFIEEIVYNREWINDYLNQIKYYYENVFCYEYYKLKWTGRF